MTVPLPDAQKPPLTVGLAGNPNTGKTTVFNALTGSKAKVANFPGVTVDSYTGNLQLNDGSTATIVDLPGCYSLTSRSPEEEIAYHALAGKYDQNPCDVVVVVVDASNLSRNLYLVSQLAEFGHRLVIALNMIDIADAAGISIDVQGLSAKLDMPVVPIVAREETGIPQLIEAVESVSSKGPIIPRKPALTSLELESVGRLQVELKAGGLNASPGHALWLLTSTDESTPISDHLASCIRTERAYLEDLKQKGDVSTFSRRVVAERYRWADDIVSSHTQARAARSTDATARADKILTHPIWGMLIFVVAMLLLFQAVFSWCNPAIDAIESAMTTLAAAIGSTLPPGVLRELLVDGLLAGVGNILVFLPQILLLFLGIAVLEESGYMARAAFLVDSLMRRVGLNGKAFVPLLSSFACAIPGVMAARIISNRRDRLITIMIAPLMSCSARMPVYTLVIGAVFASSEPVLGFLSLGGLIITALYFLGLIAALSVAWVFKKTLLKSPPPPFILEMPRYKLPALKTVFLRMYDRGKVFVIQTGTVILALSVVLWALMSYPRTSPEAHPETEESSTAQLQLKHSFAGQVGQFIEPVIEPLGFDWKIGIGLVGSFAAREVLVSTLGQVYGVGSDVDEESVVLRKALLKEINPETNKPRFTPLVGLSLMVFFVLAMQCLSTVAAVRRETASWTWPLVMIAYMNGLAWMASFATYQIGIFMGWG